MATPVEHPFEFIYPPNARQFPKRVSPLEQWYRGSEPPGCIISAGVVTSSNAPQPPVTP